MNKSTILSFTCLVMINISLEYKSTISNKEIIERDYLSSFIYLVMLDTLNRVTANRVR